jgi:nucleoside-diphosphate-sugar epimerase
MLMESPNTDEQPIETVHIGNTDEVLMRDLAERLFEVAHWRPGALDIHHSPSGSVKRRLADITKIQSLVGWKPRTALEDGLARTFQWYKEHPKQI